jgi:NACHT domain
MEKRHPESAKLHHLLSALPITPQAAFNSLDNQHRPTRLPGTRVGLLRDVMGWVDGPDKRCILWLNGIAGTGKSTVARTIARIYHDREYLGASFFFSRGDGDAARADKLFTTLAWQLANKIPQVRRYICEAIMERENIAVHSLRDQWDQLILNPLSRLDGNSSLPTVVIVIDALDECDSVRDIWIILRLLATTKSLGNIRLRVFITSRPEIPIRCGFFRMPEAERKVFVLHDILPAIVDRDIGLFFEQNFTTIREEHGFGADWPGIQVTKRLVETSGGLFIWASTACRFIREGRRLAMRRISILISGHCSGAGPEKQLDEIYTTVLKDSIQKGYDNEKQELYEILREVLGSIVILFSPLSMDSLASLLPLSSSDINETLADLHTVFNIPNQKDRPIRLHHPTFRDFILNKDRCSGLNFWVNEKQAHKALADNCIQLMSKMLKRDICGLQSPGTLAKNVDPKLIEKHIPPELQYACLYWVQHYRESETRLHDGDQAHHFFQHYFLYWLEAIALTGKSSEVAGIIRMYAALLVVRVYNYS